MRGLSAAVGLIAFVSLEATEVQIVTTVLLSVFVCAWVCACMRVCMYVCLCLCEVPFTFLRSLDVGVSTGIHLLGKCMIFDHLSHTLAFLNVNPGIYRHNQT